MVGLLQAHIFLLNNILHISERVYMEYLGGCKYNWIFFKRYLQAHG